VFSCTNYVKKRGKNTENDQYWSKFGIFVRFILVLLKTYVMGNEFTIKNSLSDAVREEIQGLPHIKTSLNEGIVNYSALARKIMPKLNEKLGKKVNEESVIVSIKRYADELTSNGAGNDYTELFANSELSMQGDISYIHFRKNDNVVSKLAKFFGDEDWKIGEMRILIHGGEQIMLLANTHRINGMMEDLSNDVIRQIDDSTLVTFRMPMESYDVYGIIAEITSMLSKKGISIEIISYPSDLHIIVQEKDVEKTYSTLKQLVNDSRRRLKEKAPAK